MVDAAAILAEEETDGNSSPNEGTSNGASRSSGSHSLYANRARAYLPRTTRQDHTAYWAVLAMIQGYHFSDPFQRQFRKLLQDWFVYLHDGGDPFDPFHPLVLAADISQIQADELLQQIDLGFEAEAETAIRQKHGYDSGPRYYEQLSPEGRRAMAGEIVALFRKTPEALAEMGPGLEYNSSWWSGWQSQAEIPPGFGV